MNEPPEILDVREQRLNDVLGAYFEAADAGWAPDPDDWLNRYPEFADELEDFFAVQARFAALARPGSSTHSRSEPLTVSISGQPVARRSAAPLTAVGDYELLEVIKRGGMGIVYKAWQKGAKRWVALKKILVGHRASAAEMRRFRDEAEAIANLDHPNIVPIYEVGEHGGQPYFSMKLFEHGSLHDQLPRFSVDHRAAAKMLATVARAVHYAHQRGILHRDLKPANILLDAQGQPHVADFGLAKRLPPPPSAPPPDDSRSLRPTAGLKEQTPHEIQMPRTARGIAMLDKHGPAKGLEQAAPSEATVSDAPGAAGRTAVGTFVGTPGYLPPEQACVSPSGLSTAADVYSLGAILYKILTGKTPFEAADHAEVVRQVLECMPEPPRARNPRVDRKLEAICLKCLRKEPDQRYSSAEALAEDLDRWIAGEPPLAWPMPWPLRAWRAGRRYLLVGAATALVTFTAAAAFFAYYYFDPDRTLAPIEHDLAAGKTVALIGETGRPKWSRWNINEGTTFVSPAVGVPFSFTTLDLGRLELLRKAPPRYRFSAEIKHEKVFENGGMVGLYFGHSEVMAEDGVKRYWWDLTFADYGAQAFMPLGPGKNGLSSEVRLIPRRYAVPGGLFTHPSDVHQLFSAAQGKMAARWRRLAVEVTPEKIRFFWGDGKPFRELTPMQLRECGAPFVANGEVVFPEILFAPEGALGIFLSAGTASFRNVIIEPLQ